MLNNQQKIKFYLNLLSQNNPKLDQILEFQWIDTKLGPMLAIANQKFLYLLEFLDKKNLEKQIKKLQNFYQIIPGNAQPIISITLELEKYYQGQLREFKTPIFLQGTGFQKTVWQELIKIPYGQTISYLQLAKEIKNPQGFRAAANANGKNRLSIIIPCHRVINANGKLGGYGGGLGNKKWLLEHENKNGN